MVEDLHNVLKQCASTQSICLRLWEIYPVFNLHRSKIIVSTHVHVVFGSVPKARQNSTVRVLEVKNKHGNGNGNGVGINQNE